MANHARNNANPRRQARRRRRQAARRQNPGRRRRNNGAGNAAAVEAAGLNRSTTPVTTTAPVTTSAVTAPVTTSAVTAPVTTAAVTAPVTTTSTAGSTNVSTDAAVDTRGVPGIGADANLTAATVKSGLANSPDALAALPTLTGSAAYTGMSTGQQGALLTQYQAAPNAATAQYLEGLATYQASDDKDVALSAYEDALNPDSGEFSVGGTSYTINNGQLMDAKGNIAGDIQTDGTYKMTADEDRTSIYDDIDSRIRMVEGTGADAKTLLALGPARSDRLNNDNMNDTFAGKATDTIRQLRRENIDMRMSDQYRSTAEQDTLYAQGRTTPGDVVTGAKGGQSWHNYGLAADMYPFDGGNGVQWGGGEDGVLWKRYGEVAEDNGLTWGGDFNDRPHVEYHPGKTPSNASSLSGDLRTGGLEGAWDKMNIGETP